MIKDIQYYSAALKFQLSPKVPFGLLYDQPFGANTEYPVKVNNTFLATQYTFVGTKANVETQKHYDNHWFSTEQIFSFCRSSIYRVW